MLPDYLPSAACPDSASLPVAQALAADFSPGKAAGVSERLRALSGSPRQPQSGTPQPPAQHPPSAPWDPLPPGDHSPVVCLHCGAMLPRASLPTCPACLHTGFLLLQRIPSLPLPPDLLDLLPSIPHYAPHVPPAAILASLPLIADWLQQFPTPVHPTAFRTTPPLPVGSSWTSFRSLDYATDWTTASSAPPPPLLLASPQCGRPLGAGPGPA